MVHVDLRGLALHPENEKTTILEAAAGENWHQTVEYALKEDLGGIENLALIPGNTGTAPVQNIGAYGVELKDSFHSLQAYDLSQEQFVSFHRPACQFGYRMSVFKGAGRGRFLITRVNLRLARPSHHRLQTGYRSLQQALENVERPLSIQKIARKVIEVRQSKLPDPAEIGNSGSFFKNPLISEKQHQQLLEHFPELVSFPADHGRRKVAAGWLIEKAGWKGFRRGDAGVHPRQALVLVNYGHAQGTEIAQLAQEIQDSVFRTFAITLEPEVNII